MSYSLVGMLVLLGAVVVLALRVGRLGRAVRSLELRAPRPASVPLPAPAPVTPGPVTPEIDDVVVAAIAAAVAVVIGRPHQIVALQADASAQHAWSAEGRREIYLSHRIR